MTVDGRSELLAIELDERLILAVSSRPDDKLLTGCY